MSGSVNLLHVVKGIPVGMTGPCGAPRASTNTDTGARVGTACGLGGAVAVGVGVVSGAVLDVGEITARRVHVSVGALVNAM